MGSITISFIHNPNTKQKELWVDYESSEDWLPAEHERRHREILKQLLDDGKLDPSMIDRVHVRVEGEEVSVEILEEDTERIQQATAEKS
jgi:hypothetical protein